jgi:hypothetical protein
MGPAESFLVIVFGKQKSIDRILPNEIKNLENHASGLDVDEAVLEEMEEILSVHSK